MRPDAHGGVHRRMPEDETAGGVYGEGVGVEVLSGRSRTALGNRSNLHICKN